MNKEQQKLLNEAYKNYSKKMMYHPVENWLDDENGEKTYRQLSQEEFINKCKTDLEFSEKWGLKIEERELTYSERYKIWFTNNFETGMEYCEDVKPDFNNEYYEPTPTKLITVTYNNKTIESYES
jgi:hypothetical protein